MTDTFKELGTNINTLTPEGGKAILRDMFGKSVENARQLRQELVELKNEQKSFQEKSEIVSDENQTIRNRYNHSIDLTINLFKAKSYSVDYSIRDFDISENYILDKKLYYYEITYNAIKYDFLNNAK